MQGIHLCISFATPAEFTVVFGFVRTVAFGTFGTLNSA